jgi:hypothetical protein
MENKFDKETLLAMLIYKKHMGLQEEVWFAEGFNQEKYTKESIDEHVNKEMVKYIKEITDGK